MPIYEFYCPNCNVIYSFLARTVDKAKKPVCPRCRTKNLKKRFSLFAMTGKGTGAGDTGSLPAGDEKMEKATATMARELEHVNENDPRQAAELMRKFSKITGVRLGEGLEDALSRVESGEDPEAVEQDMGDRLSEDDPLVVSEDAGRGMKKHRPAPVRDETLYEM